MTTATVTRQQRIELMKHLPGTVAHLVKATGLGDAEVRRRLHYLAKEQATQVIGGGLRSQVWGYYRGVPYTPPAPPAKRKVSAPATRYKTIWIGGNPYAKEQPSRDQRTLDKTN